MIARRVLSLGHPGRPRPGDSRARSCGRRGPRPSATRRALRASSPTRPHSTRPREMRLTHFHGLTGRWKMRLTLSSSISQGRDTMPARAPAQGNLYRVPRGHVDGGGASGWESVGEFVAAKRDITLYF